MKNKIFKNNNPYYSSYYSKRGRIERQLNSEDYFSEDKLKKFKESYREDKRYVGNKGHLTYTRIMDLIPESDREQWRGWESDETFYYGSPLLYGVPYDKVNDKRKKNVKDQLSSLIAKIKGESAKEADERIAQAAKEADPYENDDDDRQNIMPF